MNILPCKKLLIQQIKNSKIISKTVNTNQPQCMYSVELDSGRYYHYTKVWIQGIVTGSGPFRERNNESGKDFMRFTISDGTGNIDVLFSNLVKEKNMMHKCAFDKGLFQVLLKIRFCLLHILTCLFSFMLDIYLTIPNFFQGKNLLVTGTVMQVVGHEDTCIKAARLFELKHFCKEEWISEVKRIQCYLTALQ